jgi:chemotaxis protein MotB
MKFLLRTALILLLALAPFTLSGCIGAKIRNLKNEIFIQEARITQLKQDLAASREKSNEKTKEAATLASKLDKQNTRVKQLEDDLEKAETNLAAARLTLSMSLDSQSKEIHERLVESIEESQRNKLKIEDLENKVASKEFALLEAQQDQKELEATLIARSTELETSQKTTTELTAEIDTLSAQQIQMDSAHQVTVNQITDAKLEAENKVEASQETINTLNSEVRFLTDKLELANQEKNELEVKTTSLKTELTESKQVAVKASENPNTPSKDALTALELAKEKLASVISSKRGRIKAKGNHLEIILFSDDLFDRGTTLLTDHGLRALQAIDEIIQASPNKKISVEGHTDNTPVRNMPYPDNWELAAARATEVVRWLASQPGTDGKDIVAQSRSYFDPLMDNSTAEGRRVNRRVEIILEF